MQEQLVYLIGNAFRIYIISAKIKLSQLREK